MTTIGFRFSGRNATLARPTPKPPVVTGDSWARDRSAVGADDGTEIDATWFNRVKGSLEGLVSGLGGNLNDGDDVLKNAIAEYVNGRVATINADSATLLAQLRADLIGAGVPADSDTLGELLVRIVATESALAQKLSTSSRGAPGGVASLDGTGKVPASELPATTAYTLPSRLGTVAHGVADWNLAVENGWYMGYDAPNSPTVGQWYIGTVEAHNTLYITQTVHAFTLDGGSNTIMFRRDCNGGSWGTWYKLQLSQAEQDARYAAASHTHAAGDITLPARLGEVAATTVDWNAITATGFYQSNNAANGPTPTGYYQGFADVSDSGWSTQTAYDFVTTGAADTKISRRHKLNNVWGAWYKLQLSQAEQDARYALKSEASNSVKAWVNVDTTGAVTILGSNNVASVTDNGVGDWTVNFTAALPNANYAVIGTATLWETTAPGQISGTVVPKQTGSDTFTTKTTTACRVVATVSSTYVSPTDFDNVYIAFMD